VAKSRELTVVDEEIIGKIARVKEMRANLDNLEFQLYTQAREMDVPWSAIAAAMDLTPQAVSQRYRNMVKDNVVTE
jgi:predicted transcriptional regulator